VRVGEKLIQTELFPHSHSTDQRFGQTRQNASGKLGLSCRSRCRWTVGSGQVSKCSVYLDLLLKGKVMLVTGRGGPLGCETSRLPHFLDNLLTDGGKPYAPAAFYLQEHSWY
jgi:hypothetical protein